MSTPHQTRPRHRPPPKVAFGRIVGGGLVVAMVVAMGIWWAGSSGYIPPLWNGDWGCTDVGIPRPMPSYDDLVTEFDQSPYCARRVRGEEWF